MSEQGFQWVAGAEDVGKGFLRTPHFLDDQQTFKGLLILQVPALPAGWRPWGGSSAT